MFACGEARRVETSCPPPLLGHSRASSSDQRPRAAAEDKPGSYALWHGTGKTGDVVDVSLPFTLRTEGFRDNPRRVAFLHGPLACSIPTLPAAVHYALSSSPKRGISFTA